MVQVFLQAGAIDDAEAAAAELEAAAATFGTIALRAEAMAAVGAVRRARGGTRAAIVPLSEAVSLWQSIECPFEAAVTRLELAAAYAAISDHDGTRLELTSARTAFERVGARLAARMATAQLASLDAAIGGPSAPHRETRAFVFTDIVRSTALIEAIGDAAWVDVARWHDQALRASFARFGGDEVDHAGDGFFVAFPSAESALACAIDIQRRLADHRRTHGFAPRVRIGLHIAPVERVEAGFRGIGVHEASRICAEANGDEIVASRAFVDALPAAPPTANVRRVTPRGLSDPVDLVTIEWHIS
jgi:class 3 adenylate cyclase